MSLAGDRKSRLKGFRWQAGWQTIGMEAGGRPLTLQIHTDDLPVLSGILERTADAKAGPCCLLLATYVLTPEC
jgi:hypothetical protein